LWSAYGDRADVVHIIPKLDRQDNKVGHKLANCKPYCKRYNSLKSDSDNLEMIRLKIQLINVAYAYGLRITLGKIDKDNYFIMRVNITEGLANTHHGLNIAGEAEITKVKISKTGLEIVHTNNIITHCMGVCANSLYPSCFSSSINTNIPYTGEQM
jgi:hypothetical protein